MYNWGIGTTLHKLFLSFQLYGLNVFINTMTPKFTNKLIITLVVKTLLKYD